MQYIGSHIRSNLHDDVWTTINDDNTMKLKERGTTESGLIEIQCGRGIPDGLQQKKKERRTINKIF